MAQLYNENSINTSVTVGATSLKVSYAKKRKSFILRNVSTGGQVISLALANNVVAAVNTGIVLNVNDAVVDSNSGNYQCWSGDISAVASAAGGILSINEVLE